MAYDLIPFAQRRGLHARLAEALETSLPRASTTTIAFHYSKSCHAVEAAEWKRAVKAIQFWEMAAEEAMEGIDHHQVRVTHAPLTGHVWNVISLCPSQLGRGIPDVCLADARAKAGTASLQSINQIIVKDW